MPEGDTVWLAATRLNAALGNEKLTKTDFRVPRYATVDLSGRTLEEVVAKGKHLLFRVGPRSQPHRAASAAATPSDSLEGRVTVHTHFEMDGSWDLYRPRDHWRRRAHEIRAVLETESWVAVGRRLPVLELVPSHREDDAVGHLGPDVLGDDWDRDEVVRRMGSRTEWPIGDVLLDQRVLAGVGNVYKSEICFLRGIHPSTPVRAVRDLEDLIDLTKRLMEANRDTGSHITTGDTRRGRRHWVYGRAGEPCLRCGSTVERRREGGRAQRVTFWCPSCQPMTLP